MALSLGTMAAEVSQRTRFTCSSRCVACQHCDSTPSAGAV